jgi:hypothetical protein
MFTSKFPIIQKSTISQQEVFQKLQFNANRLLTAVICLQPIHQLIKVYNRQPI